jgi:hypothetical protein
MAEPLEMEAFLKPNELKLKPCVYVQSSLAFKLTVLRSTFLCLSIEFSLATVILYAKNCTHQYNILLF